MADSGYTGLMLKLHSYHQVVTSHLRQGAAPLYLEPLYDPCPATPT